MFKETNYIIENHLTDNWPHTAIDYDNVEFHPVRGTPFIRAQIEWVDSNVVSVPGRIRGAGYLDVSIFIPYGESAVKAYDFADQISELFTLWSIDGLRFSAASVRRVGQQEEWYQVKVVTPFEYDECFIKRGYGGYCGYGN